MDPKKNCRPTSLSLWPSNTSSSKSSPTTPTTPATSASTPRASTTSLPPLPLKRKRTSAIFQKKFRFSATFTGARRRNIGESEGVDSKATLSLEEKREEQWEEKLTPPTSPTSPFSLESHLSARKDRQSKPNSRPKSKSKGKSNKFHPTNLLAAFKAKPTSERRYDSPSPSPRLEGKPSTSLRPESGSWSLSSSTWSNFSTNSSSSSSSSPFEMHPGTLVEWYVDVDADADIGTTENDNDERNTPGQDVENESGSESKADAEESYETDTNEYHTFLATTKCTGQFHPRKNSTLSYKIFHDSNVGVGFGVEADSRSELDLDLVRTKTVPDRGMSVVDRFPLPPLSASPSSPSINEQTETKLEKETATRKGEEKLTTTTAAISPSGPSSSSSIYYSLPKTTNTRLVLQNIRASLEQRRSLELHSTSKNNSNANAISVLKDEGEQKEKKDRFLCDEVLDSSLPYSSSCC